jgi:antitoxin MazE
MKNRLQKWGNSLAVRIPKPFAEELGWTENAPVRMSLEDGMLVVKTDKERCWDLATLLEKVTAENVHPCLEEEGTGVEGEERKSGGEAG